MKQKEAVFNATSSIINLEAGVRVLDVITDAQNAHVVEIVAAGIANGEVDFSTEARAKYNTPDLIKKYVIGMVNNWYRKDTRLNGGSKYEAKNPGSRSTDPVVKTLRQLLKTDKVTNDPEAKAAIEAEIEQRLADSKPKQVKEATIDMTLVPEHIANLVK